MPDWYSPGAIYTLVRIKKIGRADFDNSINHKVNPASWKPLDFRPHRFVRDKKKRSVCDKRGCETSCNKIDEITGAFGQNILKWPPLLVSPFRIRPTELVLSLTRRLSSWVPLSRSDSFSNSLFLTQWSFIAQIKPRVRLTEVNIYRN